jgi:hypothetical protein
MASGHERPAHSLSGLAEAMAVVAAELAGQDGSKVDLDAFRDAIGASIGTGTAAFDWLPAGCHVTRVTTEKCGSGGGVIYQLVAGKVDRSPIRAGGGHCGPCVNGVRTCWEYECEPTTVK